MKRIIGTILLFVIIVGGVFLFSIKAFRVNGASMNPTLYANNLVISKKVNLKNLKRQDIVVFSHHGNVLIKRVIGLPNDQVVITNDGLVYVNDELLEEDYVETFSFASEIVYPYVVPEGEVFVLGDNRVDSLDSRIIGFGTVKENEILGKIVLTIPL